MIERSWRRTRFLRTARPTRRPTANATFGGSASATEVAFGQEGYRAPVLAEPGNHPGAMPRRCARSRTRQIRPTACAALEPAGAQHRVDRRGSTSGAGSRAAWPVGELFGWYVRFTCASSTTWPPGRSPRQMRLAVPCADGGTRKKVTSVTLWTEQWCRRGSRHLPARLEPHGDCRQPGPTMQIAARPNSRC